MAYRLKFPFVEELEVLTGVEYAVNEIRCYTSDYHIKDYKSDEDTESPQQHFDPNGKSLLLFRFVQH